MKTKKLDIVIFFIFLVTGLIVGYIDLLFKTSPTLTYNLNIAPMQDAVEQPLNIAVNNKSADFSFKVIDRPGANDDLRLIRKFNFSNEFPFFVPSNELRIQLYDSEKTPEEEYKLYEFNGTIKNLFADKYKITIYDSADNIVDQRLILLNEPSLF